MSEEQVEKRDSIDSKLETNAQGLEPEQPQADVDNLEAIKAYEKSIKEEYNKIKASEKEEEESPEEGVDKAEDIIEGQEGQYGI